MGVQSGKSVIKILVLAYYLLGKYLSATTVVCVVVACVVSRLNINTLGEGGYFFSKITL